MKKKYVYYVAYISDKGMNSAEVIRNAEIKTNKDIKSIVDGLKKQEGLKNVVILNFIRLKGE